ncbi:MAG: acyltransferase family protein [Halopseudomonas yangmingensis]
MQAPSAIQHREHAMDNLRALMMWLGIVLHSAINHMTGPQIVPWRDAATTQLADVLVVVIHSFRMPVFLIIAGYFVALLVERRGARQMLGHRLRRLALPFVLFWPVIFVATALLVMLYVHRAELGHFGLQPDLVPVLPDAPRIATMHMWFLYQLSGLALLTFALLWLAPRLPAALRTLTPGLFHWLAERPWGFAVLALPLALIGVKYPHAVLVVNGSFVPPLSEWLHHGLFYAFGYCLYQQRQQLLAGYKRLAGYYFWGGLLSCLLALLLLDQLVNRGASGFALQLLTAFSYNATTWLWSFALIGLALRYLNRQHAVLRYLADSSYWVYLVHMLGTIGFGALLYGMPLPAELKILLNIIATTLVGLASYQLLVRNTRIGQLLNGKRIAPAGKAGHLSAG